MNTSKALAKLWANPVEVYFRNLTGERWWGDPLELIEKLGWARRSLAATGNREAWQWCYRLLDAVEHLYDEAVEGNSLTYRCASCGKTWKTEFGLPMGWAYVSVLSLSDDQVYDVPLCNTCAKQFEPTEHEQIVEALSTSTVCMN